MKKRRLKKWVKTTIGIVITFIIMIILLCIISKRVEFFNNNIEKCGTNYCDK